MYYCILVIDMIYIIDVDIIPGPGDRSARALHHDIIPGRASVLVVCVGCVCDNIYHSNIVLY